MMRPVAITGIGPVTSHGVGIDPLWAALESGETGLRPVEAFDASAWPCPWAGQLPAEAMKIRSLVPKSYRKATKVMCRDIELAIAAAAAAVTDAGIETAATEGDGTTLAADRVGCHIGAGLICADVNELGAALVTSRCGGAFDLHHWGDQGMQNLTPLWLLKYLPNMLACHVTIVHDCRGPSNTITCWESSATLSLAESMRVIQRGAADACLTGGAESRLNVLATWRQVCAGRLAQAGPDADPNDIVRPFADDAQGTVLGEGGGIFVIEDLEHARNRSASVKAIVDAVACTQTVDDDTGLGASSESIADAVEMAFARANLSPRDIDAVVPMGLGVPEIDAAEAQAIASVFGDAAAQLPIVLVTPSTGNCCAGHGAVQLAVAVQCLVQQRLPARHAGCARDGLDTGEISARDADLRRVLVMTASQGGQNTATILSRELTA